MEEKKYINIDNMATRLCQILKDARESMVDDENKDFIMENFSDEYLEDYSNVMAWQFNSDMKKYLHNPDHRICGNFNNIDYDYPYHIYGEVTYDTPLVNAMIARLDAGEDSEQANEDRDFLADWFFETFGTWGISSDEQINKMRAFITEMVLTELSNLKQFDIVFKKKGIRSLDTLYCPKCGSNNVEERAWVNPNTDEISYNDSVEEEDCWCNICEEHVELCTLSELWEMFGDIPVNNDDEIEEDFLNFPAGTPKFDVWRWFDERCLNNLHDDLMFPQNDAV